MEYLTNNGINIAVVEKEFIINEIQDALDLMADAKYIGNSTTIIAYTESFINSFFDLKSQFAGNLLQKFSTYNVRLAIVGDISKYLKSKAFSDFVYECNKSNHILWVNDLDTAINILTK